MQLFIKDYRTYLILDKNTNTKKIVKLLKKEFFHKLILHYTQYNFTLLHMHAVFKRTVR